MNIGLLKQRIIIQQNTAVVDSIGNHRAVWNDYYSCAATVSGEGGNEEMDTGQTVDASKVEFTVRYCAAIAAVTCTNHRVLFWDDVFNILSIDHMNYKRKAVKLKCQKVRR